MEKKMEINRQNYVDQAEKVIQDIGKTNLTTSKIRNLLAMTAELKTAAQHSRDSVLSKEMQSRVQYLKMRIAYEAGREKTVKDFVERAGLLTLVSSVGQDRERLLLFCDYMEALTAYHRFYGGKDN